MKKSMCPICRSKNTRLVYAATISSDYFDKPYKISSSDYGKHLDIVQCINCRTLFEDISGLTTKIAAHYKTLKDTAYENERENRSQAFARIVRQIKKIKPDGELLDIGCATGAFLIEAQRAGYKIQGIEPSPWAVNIAQKKHRLNVSVGTIETANLPHRSFDIITLLDVIEHLENPREVLKQISRLLKKDGILVIVTPNSHSLAARALGQKWWHIRPSHFFYFNPSTFYPLLKENGLEIIKSRNYKWYLSASYLLERFLKLFSIEWKRMPDVLSRIPVGINLFDSMELYARKK